MSSSQKIAPINMSQMQPGQRARIQEVHGRGRLRQRFFDLGLVKGTLLDFIDFAPLGDPLHINVRGFSLAIRRHEAEQIEVTVLEPAGSAGPEGMRRYESTLPGLSLAEIGIDKNGKPGNRSETTAECTILLAGNPNCGKSTLFNALTGARQHVGNWPGKTVEKKEGLWVERGACCRVIDLPGTYSLTAYSLEEIIARDAILECSADLVAIVIDAANLERNLYLALQILEMGVPAILVLNMWDVAQSNGVQIDVAALADRLGIPVLPTALSTGVGLAPLKKQLLACLDKEKVF